MEHALRAAHIPPAYRHATLDSFETDTPAMATVLQRVRDRVETYSAEDNRGVMLIGPNGVGKTHLAVGMLRALIERGLSGAFYNVISLLDEFKAEYSRQESTSTVMEDDLSRAVLVLDDLGVQRATGWSAERLHAVINRRYELGRTLIVTTNKTPSQLRRELESAIVSRLYEMCLAISLDGIEDRRLRYARGTLQTARQRNTTPPPARNNGHQA